MVFSFNPQESKTKQWLDCKKHKNQRESNGFLMVFAFNPSESTRKQWLYAKNNIQIKNISVIVAVAFKPQESTKKQEL